MFEVNQDTIWDYFQGPGREWWQRVGFRSGDWKHSTAQTLAWGVSNVVIRVESPRGPFVLKQSRAQLRTKIDWFSRLDRIWREVEVLQVLLDCTPKGSVPQFLFEDRANYLYVMEAVDADHRVWKADLLAGQVDQTVAVTLGKWLAQVHRGTTGRAELQTRLSDREVFDELRLDPFYRYVAQNDQRVRNELESLIEHSLARQDCLVLADFSPKNILLTSQRPVVVDFETGHYGDPGFDLGFFLSHVLLKTVRNRRVQNDVSDVASPTPRCAEFMAIAHSFWSTYIAALSAAPAPGWSNPSKHVPNFEAQCVRHLAACMLARIDGKSRVDYLHETDLPIVREYCHSLLHDRVSLMAMALERLESMSRA